ncbi:hypothetical protein ACQP04_09855 [Pseudonocardia halophobica]|uniref:hypothetical protein n=1 Tax=Pseudonocardia halophobica TaxID=29401 RepID=UPI003D8B2C3F
MMEFGLLDRSEVLPMIRTRIVNLWAAIEPYVEIERQRAAVAGSITVLMTLERHAVAGEELPDEQLRVTPNKE